MQSAGAQAGFFGDEGMLNPQPLPPRIAQVSYGEDVAINPQPLPPRVATYGKNILLFKNGQLLLNPQPEPPGIAQ